MGCDAVLALGRASVDGSTLFGQNSSRPEGSATTLCRTPGRSFATGEKLQTPHLELSQARQTCTVIGSRPSGCWGYDHGLNEHQVAIGCVALRAALACDKPGLLGTDLVRLALEQSRNARQAVDVMTHLIKRYGQGTFPGCEAEAEHDNAFLIADPREAYVIETAGKYWVYQEIREVRAQSNVRVIHQDWDAIASGLAGLAIEHGWWSPDGSKLDFAGALGEEQQEQETALARWGRATLLLQEQNGNIDLAFIRRILCDHADEAGSKITLADEARESASLCRHARGPSEESTAASLVACLSENTLRPPMAWCALGPPCTSVYFPVFLQGELPEALSQYHGAATSPTWEWRLHKQADAHRPHRELWASARESLTRLQARIDQETEEFVQECVAVRQRGRPEDLHRQTSLFMQHHVEQFEEIMARSASDRPKVPTVH